MSTYNKDYYESHKEEIKKKRRERYAKDPSYQRNYARNLYKTNPDLCKQRCKISHEKHKEAFNKYEAEYFRSHPELHKDPKLSYDYKKSKDFTCEMCGVKGNSRTMHAHHKVPLLSGGLDVWENLMCLCPDCHNKIHHSDPQG